MGYYRDLLSELESLASEDPRLAEEVAFELMKDADFQDGIRQLKKQAEWEELPEETEMRMNSDFMSLMDPDESSGQYDGSGDGEVEPKDLKYLVGEKLEKAIRKLKGEPEPPKEEAEE